MLCFGHCNYCKSSTFCCVLCWTTDALWLQLQKGLFGEKLVFLFYQAAEITRICLLTSLQRDRKCLLKILCQICRIGAVKCMSGYFCTNSALSEHLYLWKHELNLYRCLYPSKFVLYIFIPPLLPWVLENTENHAENLQKKEKCLAESDSYHFRWACKILNCELYAKRV